MKEYKRTYGTSLPCCYLKLCVIAAPCGLVGDIILFFLNKSVFGTVSLIFVVVSLLFVVLSLSFVVLISLIINAFKDASVLVDEKSITHMDKTLALDEIKYISLYLPKTISKVSSSPQELSIYISDEEHMVIRRPSIKLIAYLKKRCENAKFEIDELKSRLKMDLIIGICLAIVFSVIALFVI